MNELIRPEDDPPAPAAISQTDFRPVRDSDASSTWRKFWDAIRQMVGLKPLDLALRFGEAEARKREAEAYGLEVDNELKLLKAKQEYELVQAEIRRAEFETQNKSIEAKALADKIRAETRSTKSLARIQEAAAREIEKKSLSTAEAMNRVLSQIEKIQSLGGAVEIVFDGELKGPSELPLASIIEEARRVSPGSTELSPEGSLYRQQVCEQYPDAIAVILDESIMPLVAPNPDRPKLWSIFSGSYGGVLGQAVTESEAWEMAAGSWQERSSAG